MSFADKEIATVDDKSGDGDDDEGGRGSHGRCSCSDEKKQRGFISGNGFSRNFGKAKQVVLHPFTRSKKPQLPRKNKIRSSSSSSAAACFVSSRFRGGGVNGGGGSKGCYFCFTQPQTLDSPTGSQNSDPEHPNFTFAMLRAFVEKNDFYSKECNPHFDIIDVPSNTMD